LTEGHYDRDYFNWQKEIGEIGGELNRFKFEEFIDPGDTVLDFGCGGGYLLKGLRCRRRIAIEINESAAGTARENGIEVFRETRELPDDIHLDRIISNHALEHVGSPLEELSELREHLAPDGRMIFVVPLDDWRRKDQRRYRPGDVNQHMHAFTPLTIGNLFANAGLHVERVEIITHAWPRHYKKLYQVMPGRLFHLICRLWAVSSKRRQIRIIAHR